MMKLFIFLAFLGLAASFKLPGMLDHKKEMMKWKEWKAWEGCWGKENMKAYKVANKKAMKKCMGMPAPELKLHKMIQPHRLVESMLMGVKDKKHGQMEKLVSYMKSKDSSPVAYVPYPMVQHSESGGEKMMMMFMKKMMMMKMMKMLMKGHEGVAESFEDFEEEPKSSELESPAFDEANVEALVRSILQTGAQASKRSRRATNAELYDLGDELTEKLENKMKEFEIKMSNASCFLKEQGVVDENMNLDLESMLKSFDGYDVEDKWLVSNARKIVRHCYAVAESLPREVLKEEMSEQWGKLKMFNFCHEKKNTMLCMGKDVKEMLEEHFKSLDELVEETGIEENMLLHLTHNLIEDSFQM